ncbi:MAG: hypothetical protein AAGA92_05850 [Planctomycetota bacterium]
MFAPAASARVEEGEPESTTLEITELVERLGSDLFVERDAAQRRLESLGVRAFDALQEAVKHPDLEIATRARHILQRVQVEWVKPTDPPAVQQVMKRFAAGSMAERLEAIEELEDVPEATGGPALCRIARFETSPAALQAAMSALSLLELAAADGIDNEAWWSELDDSQSAAARWAGLGLRGLEAPGQVQQEWDREVAEIVERFRASGEVADAELAYGLMLHQLFVCRSIDEPAPLMGVLTDLAEFLASLKEEQLPDLPGSIRSWFESEEDQSAKAVGYQLFWASDKRDWELFSQLFEEHPAEISQNRFLMYLVALGRSEQGDTNGADEASRKALAFQADDTEDRNVIAASLLESGRLDWAAAEWRAVIAALPILHPESMGARQELGNWWLHDREQYRAAAELFDEFCEAAEASAEAEAAMLADLAETMESVEPDQGAARALSIWKSFQSVREFFRASHKKSLGEHQQEALHLEKAYRLNPLNPDILIAMYRVEGADPAYRARVRDLIKSLRRRLQHVIEAGLASGEEDAQNYNFWAWLVSNTEGDYEQAVKYSLRSLELDPGNASFLDTLGRCYYAVGDYNSAIKYQKQAVERQPMVQVMRRQLAMFQEAAAQQAEESKPSAAGIGVKQ